MADQPQIQATSESFEKFLREHPNRLFELIHREIGEKVVTEELGYIALNIGTEVRNYLKQNRIGRASVETRYRPKDDQLNDRLPDVSFRRTESDIIKVGPLLGTPALAVETSHRMIRSRKCAKPLSTTLTMVASSCPMDIQYLSNDTVAHALIMKMNDHLFE